jgi:magnesium transporter
MKPDLESRLDAETSSQTISDTTDVTRAGLRTIIDRPGLLWLDLEDPHSTALDELAVRYGFHELAVEDCRHQIQLAKVDHYDGYVFIVVHTTQYREEPCEIDIREIDIFMGPEYLVSVHYGPSMAVNEIRRRLAGNGGQVTRPDHVLHAIVDVVVDRYLPTLDHIGDTIDDVQDKLLVNPDVALLQTMFTLKRGLLQFRRAATSQRELLNALIRDESHLIKKDMRIYFRDVYDHAVRALDLLETYRDLLTGGLDIYLTQMANKTNDIVKALTILATIMLPLTVVTGYFGMNFKYIPFGENHFGIWYITAGLLFISGTMLGWFKYKKWL